MTAGLYVLYGPGKIFENPAVLTVYELHLVQSSHELFLTARKEIGIAYGAEQYLTVMAHQLRHLFNSLRLSRLVIRDLL